MPLQHFRSNFHRPLLQKVFHPTCTSSQLNGPLGDCYCIVSSNTNLHSDLFFLNRHPIPIKTHGNVIRSFSNLTWAFIFFSLLLIGQTLALIYYVYVRYLPEQFLTKHYVHQLDFIVLTFAGLAEPEPLPWFTRFSTGDKFISKGCIDTETKCLQVEC